MVSVAEFGKACLSSDLLETKGPERGLRVHGVIDRVDISS
jgi:hypothetical protein